MTPELLAVIQAVLLDAIKILGPAVIAAYAAYRAAFVQIELKLKEMEKGHQFQARSAIFTDLKDRLAHIEQQTEKLNAELGHILGFAAGYRLGTTRDEPNEVVDLMLRAAESAAKAQPLETTVVLADMRAAGMASSQEYAALVARQAVQLPISGEPNYDRLKVLIVEMLETSHLLGVCTRLLLRKEMELVFAPYLPAPR
jgi:hypothetical protein